MLHPSSPFGRTRAEPISTRVLDSTKTFREPLSLTANPTSNWISVGHYSTPSDRSEPSPRSGAVLIQDDPDLDPGWTRKRLRPQMGRGIEVPERRDDNLVQAPLVSAEIGTARKRKALSTSSSKIVQRSEDDPINSMARRIGHSDKAGEMQQMIYELQNAADQTPALAESGSNTSVISCEVDPARLFQVVPTVARQTEESAACEQLSRIRNRLALAEFYRAYRAAQAQPDQFLQVVNQILPTPAARSAAPNRTKRAKVKTSTGHCTSRMERSTNYTKSSESILKFNLMYWLENRPRRTGIEKYLGGRYKCQ